MNETEPIQFTESFIKKYPYLSFSENLIDYFLIIGYDQQVIKKEIISETNKDILKQFPKSQNRPSELIDQDTIKHFQYSTRPSIINSISSDTKMPIPNDELLLSLIFPVPPIIYYCNESNKNYEVQQRSVIFFINPDSGEEEKEQEAINLQDNPEKQPYHGYAYIFFESIVREGLKVYIPKTFCFISHYPLYTTFNALSKEIMKVFLDKDNNEIPIEILLYNLVNYVPSPFYNSLIINLFPNRSLNFYADQMFYRNKNLDNFCLDNSYISNMSRALERKSTIQSQGQKTNQKIMFIEKIGGYPIFNFNFSEIFKILTTENLLEIFLLSFLEQDLVFVSKNLEALNLIMYAISCLSYPTTDTSYLWHIVSVSKDLFCQLENDYNNPLRKFVNNPWTSMRGVNCCLDNDILDSSSLKGKYVVDLDNKKTFFQTGGTNQENEEKIIDLLEYARKIMKGKSVESGFLAMYLSSLYAKIDVYFKKVLFNNNANLNDEEVTLSFFEVDKRISANNKIILEEFYEFNLNIFKVVYSSYSLRTLEEINVKHQDNGEIKRMLSMLKNTNYFIFPHRNYDGYSQEEKNFLSLFEESGKFSKYFVNFIQLQKCGVLYKIPYSFSEEFLSLKSVESQNFQVKYFEIIDHFYLKHYNQSEKEFNKCLSISFETFYLYYQNNLREFCSTLIKSSGPIKKKTHKLYGNNKKITYEYLSIELSQDILSHYAYYLSTKDDNELILIFPSYLLQKENVVTKVKERDISNWIENSLLFYKRGIDFLSLTTFQMFGLTSYYSKEQVLLIPMLDKSFISKLQFRKYITLLISIYYRKAKEKLKKKDSSLRYDIMNCNSLLNMLRLTRLLPTKQLLNIIQAYEEIKYNLKSIGEKESEVKEKELNKEIYSLSIKDNKCKCRKGEKNLDFFITFADTFDYNQKSVYKCEKCNKEIKPRLILQSKKTSSKTFTAELYMPAQLFKNTIKLMNMFLVELDMSKIDKKLFNSALINLICYLNHRGRVDRDIPLFFFRYLMSE